MVQPVKILLLALVNSTTELALVARFSILKLLNRRYCAPFSFRTASVTNNGTSEMLLPEPLIVMVLVALAPGILVKVTVSIYGPEPGTTVTVTGPLTPQLESICVKVANEGKLEAD